MFYKSFPGSLVSWFFGTAVLAAGLVNTFWGNDPGFGLFLLLLSFVYFPPANAFIQKRYECSIPLMVKLFLAAFIIWATLGVGELFDKIELMKRDL